MLTLVSGLIVLLYEEVFSLSEHSLIAKKEQEGGISCVFSIKNYKQSSTRSPNLPWHKYHVVSSQSQHQYNWTYQAHFLLFRLDLLCVTIALFWHISLSFRPKIIPVLTTMCLVGYLNRKRKNHLGVGKRTM